MTTLSVGSRSGGSVFDLLGRDENDITYAIGWCLAESDEFLQAFVGRCGLVLGDDEETRITLQRHSRDDARRGITDIEVRSREVHLVVEAKRGWGLPTVQQLEKYAPILAMSRVPKRGRRFVVLTRWGSEAEVVVRHRIGREVGGFPISTLGMTEVALLARRSFGVERRQRPRTFLHDLVNYLEGAGYVGNHRDTRAYVVPLSTRVSEVGVPYNRIPYELGVYWYGTDGPKLPPNFVAFRFGGRLQSIHHVERSEHFASNRDVYPKATQTWGPGVLLHLGPAIEPKVGVKSGPIRDTKVWADIDLLLTSPTVQEAAALTRERDRRQRAT